RVALSIALLAGVAVVVSEAADAAGSGSPAAMLSYLTTGLAGLSRSIRVLAEALALLGAFIGAPVLPSVVAALVALAASGHAADVHPAWWGVVVDSIHLLSAGHWAGGIMALATQRPPGGWRGEEARRLLDRFSPVALTAFLV